MRNRFLLGMMALSLIGMTSCKDEIDQFDDHGSSTIVSFVGSEKAYMGDSISNCGICPMFANSSSKHRT